jgi:two-component system sensor histidine kinase KdpD
LLERADQIELVDIPPEELMQRLAEGKVYLGDQASRAGQNFFKRGNLLALRELALRRTAERVDADVQTYRAEHGVTETWSTSERILVCIGPSPGSARLVRAARRMAAGLRAPWVAGYVEVTGMAPFGEAARQRLDGHLRLAESLGATIVRLTGAKVSEALLAYARRHNVTRIILGKPTHPRIRDLVRGSLLDEVVRGSGEIDVHVISGDENRPTNGHEAAAQPLPEQANDPERYLSAMAVVGLTTALAYGLAELLPIPDVEMLYLLAVMVCAVSFGRGPSIVGAALSVAAYDFFFVPPRFTFAVADGRYLLTFVMMFVVGIVISALTHRVRRQEAQALAREERTRALYDLSRDLAAAFGAARIAEVTARHVSDSFGGSAVVYLPEENAATAPAAAWPVGTSIDPNDVGVVKWVLEHGRAAGRGTDTLPGAGSISAPIRTAAEPLGVIALVTAGNVPLRSDEQAFLEALGRQAGFALDRSRLAEQARQSALAAKTEELRSSLLSTVSHDLRTPLAAITGAATTLRDEGAISADMRDDLIGTICEEAERLERLVSNLLDMTRLESGHVRLRREWVPLEEVVGSALERLEKHLHGHTVTTDLDDDLPLVSIDPILLEQLLVNLLENAAKYTPTGTEVTIAARSTPGELQLDVLDRGPGIPPGDEERIFERFYRGPHSRVSGVGLGLPICRAIARAHGGTLDVVARDGGGARFRIRIPQPDGRPSTPPEAPAEPT